MSTSKRLISGTLASWVRIGVTIASQLVLVPIYLNNWDVQTYGIWIAIQALVNILTTLDRGHVEYLGYEFLKFGSVDKSRNSVILWSGMLTTLVSGVLGLIVIMFIAFSPIMQLIIGETTSLEASLLSDIGWTLVIQWMGWVFISNTSGLIFRALMPYGYFPRMGWWNVLTTIITSVSTVYAVAHGANILTASIWWIVSLISISTIQALDLYRLMLREKMPFKIFSVEIACNNYIISLLLSLRFFLENLRQMGVRLLITPIVGPIALAEFATIRTGANLSQQGLLTITHPMLPELMRFLNKKEQEKMEVTFATIWLVLTLILSPMVLILQEFAPYLFSLWTNNHLTYNALLFGSLSIGVLTFALAQPAMSILIGNNMLKEQMKVASVAALALLIALYTLIPIIGIEGAGVSLLLSEIVAAFMFITYAKNWLTQSGLKWPLKPAKISTNSVIIVSIGIIINYLFPSISIYSLVIFLVAILINSIVYWRYMPQFAKDKVMLFYNNKS